jgi:hypothetical protein
VRAHERQRGAADPIQGRSDERAVPVGEREERRGADGGREPHADQQRAAAELVGRETDRDEAGRRNDIADAEDEADVGRSRAQVLEEQREQRAQEAEPNAPEDLGNGEGAGFLAEA